MQYKQFEYKKLCKMNKFTAIIRWWLFSIKNCDDQNYVSRITCLYVLNKYLFSVDIIVCRRNMVIPIQNGSSLNPMGFVQSNIRKECNIFSRRRLNMTLLNTWIIKNISFAHLRHMRKYENSTTRDKYTFLKIVF